MARAPRPATRAEPSTSPGKGLRTDVVGFWDGLAIGLDSTAPAYSLAAALGSLVVLAGTHAPAVLLLSFVPIFLIAGAFHHLNKADQDCGTTFSWVTRALGPTLGWLGGWSVLVTGVVVVGSLADVAASYLLELAGLDGLAGSRPAVVASAVLLILVLTWLTARGTEVSARVQRVLVLVQVAALLAFVVAASVRLLRGGGALTPSPSWLSPAELDAGALVPGLLLGVFLYWGWESAVSLNEESSDRATAPGRAGLVSTLVLLALYLGVTITLVAVAGLDLVAAYDDDAGLFGAVAGLVLGPFAPVLVLAIITSGIASTQTTLLPASRTALSMAAAGAFPRVFGRVDLRSGTPATGTWLMGLASAGWYVGASLVSDNFLFDSLAALSLLIALYYALTGLACAVYWRRRLRHSARAFLLVGVGPLAGAAMLLYLLYRSVVELADPRTSATGTPVAGLGLPLAIALVFVVAGLVTMLVWRLGPGAAFFARRGGETVPEEVTLAALPVGARSTAGS